MFTFKNDYITIQQTKQGCKLTIDEKQKETLMSEYPIEVYGDHYVYPEPFSCDRDLLFAILEDAQANGHLVLMSDIDFGLTETFGFGLDVELNEDGYDFTTGHHFYFAEYAIWDLFQYIFEHGEVDLCKVPLLIQGNDVACLKRLEKEGWIITDMDLLQFCKVLGEDKFLFKQYDYRNYNFDDELEMLGGISTFLDEYWNKSNYWIIAEIDLNDYSDEDKEIAVSGYFGNMEEFLSTNCEDHKRVLAECIFETDIFEY